MSDIQPDSLGLNGSLVNSYRTLPADTATLDDNAIKGRVKVAVPQLDSNGNPIAISEEQAAKATVIRNGDGTPFWISAALERVQVAGDAEERYGDYTVPAATVKKILRQDEELTYREFLKRSELQTYAELQGYLDTLRTALQESQGADGSIADSRWVVVASADAEVKDAEAVERLLRNAPENAGMVHLAGTNKYGGFGELPIAVEGADDLVEPTRFYGASRATAFRADALPAVIAALETNLKQSPLRVVEGEEVGESRGGISPLDHVFALLQRSAALRVHPEERHPEDGAVLDAFRRTQGERSFRIYAMNPPAIVEKGNIAPPIRPVEHRIAREMRELMHGLQMDGNAEAVHALDPLVKCCVDQTAQRWLPPFSLLEAAKEIHKMAGHKEALTTVTELIKTRFINPAERVAPLEPRALGKCIQLIGSVKDNSEALEEIKEAMKHKQSPLQLQMRIQAICTEAARAVPGRAASGGARGL